MNENVCEREFVYSYNVSRGIFAATAAEYT